MTNQTLDIKIPEKLKPVFAGSKRYRVAYGGRGSGKTWSFGQMAIAKSLSGRFLFCCTREFQNKIKDSVHSLLCNIIDMFGLTASFRVTETEIECIPTGSRFIFKGVRRNHAEIKGTEGIDVLWMDEAQPMLEEAFRDIAPTIRNSNSEIWITFNPDSELDFVYQHFVINPPKDSAVVKINYHDNPWFPEVLEKERIEDLRRSESMHNHVWLGECLAANQRLMLPMDRVKAAVDQSNAYRAQSFILGVDPSQGAGDKTAFCWRWGDVVDEIQAYDNFDEMQCVGKIVLEAKSPACAGVVIDSTGFGTTIMRRCQELGLSNITGVNFGSADVINKVYANKRAEIYGCLRDALQKDQPPSLPNDPLLIKELSYVPWRLTSSGKTILESKDEIKKYLGHSPDMADALALTYAPYLPQKQYSNSSATKKRPVLPY